MVIKSKSSVIINFTSRGKYYAQYSISGSLNYIIKINFNMIELNTR